MVGGGAGAGGGGRGGGEAAGEVAGAVALGLEEGADAEQRAALGEGEVAGGGGVPVGGAHQARRQQRLQRAHGVELGREVDRREQADQAEAPRLGEARLAVGQRRQRRRGGREPARDRREVE